MNKDIEWFALRGWIVHEHQEIVTLTRKSGPFDVKIDIKSSRIITSLKYDGALLESAVTYDELLHIMNICNALRAGKVIEI